MSEKKNLKSTFPPLPKQQVQQEIKAHSHLAHGIIKVNENSVLLTGELCHATVGRKAQASQELFPAAEETKQSRDKRELLFKKVLVFKEDHGVNHKASSMNIYGAKLSTPIPHEIFHWL